MKLGIVITMYDEFDVVKESIMNSKKSTHDLTWVVMHSDNGNTNEELEFIKTESEYTLLDNLAKKLDRFELPSASVCRNYSLGFTKLYQMNKDYDLVIGITGDSLITNLDELLSPLNDSYDGYVLQAIGQYFHDKNDDPKNGKTCNRPQTENTTDIMPQFFMFRGSVAIPNKLFTYIENINKFTSEQNLGDEVVRVIPNFKEKVKRLHDGPYVYDYYTGIILQIKGLGHTRINL